MDGLSLILLGVGFFTLIVLLLVVLILLAKSRLVPGGEVKILINGDEDKALTVDAGEKLLNALAAQKVYLPSACGGGGTCGQCKCRRVRPCQYLARASVVRAGWHSNSVPHK